MSVDINYCISFITCYKLKIPKEYVCIGWFIYVDFKDT